MSTYEKRSGQNSQNIFLEDIIRDWNESITSRDTHDTPEHSEGVTNTPARPVGTTYDGLAESMENVTNTHL